MKIRYQQFALGGRRPGPVAQFVAAIVAAVVIVSALLLGFVFFIFIFGLLVFAGVAFWIRSWLSRGSISGAVPDSKSGHKGHIETLEGEFEVLDSEKNQSRKQTSDDESGL